MGVRLQTIGREESTAAAVVTSLRLLWWGELGTHATPNDHRMITE